MDAIYAKYSRYRLPEFQMATIIYREDGKLFSKKTALTPKAQEHVRQIYDNFCTLKESWGHVKIADAKIKDEEIFFEYINGESFNSKLLQSVLKRDKEEFLNLLRKYTQFINGLDSFKVDHFKACDEFLGIFKQSVELRDVTCLRITNIDLVFDNIFLLGKNEYAIIDYEWVFRFPVPTEYIIYRSVMYFSRYREYLQNFIDIDEIFDYLQIDKQKVEIFGQMENSFMEHVAGKKTLNCLSQKYIKTTNSLLDIEQKAVDALRQTLVDCERRLSETESVLADRDRRLSEATCVIEDRERQLCHRKEIVAATENQLREAKDALAAKEKLFDTIKQLQHRLPFRLAEKITGKKMIDLSCSK
ncbi:MAG: hypothetical protein WC373_16505 [Smithella sp.]|jgi:hypothetical protein